MGLTPVTRHSRWVAEAGVPSSDRSIYECQVISQALEFACGIDQLKVVALLAFEFLLRRLQLIEEAHSISSVSPVYEGSEHWMGSNPRRGGARPATKKPPKGASGEEGGGK